MVEGNLGLNIHVPLKSIRYEDDKLVGIISSEHEGLYVPRHVIEESKDLRLPSSKKRKIEYDEGAGIKITLRNSQSTDNRTGLFLSSIDFNTSTNFLTGRLGFRSLNYDSVIGGAIPDNLADLLRGFAYVGNRVFFEVDKVTYAALPKKSTS